MHGLFLLNKASGMTSHDVVRRLRRLCRTRRVGHAGTLDPLATGVLPVAVGNGTKILQFLLAENKTYRAGVKLGVTTDTLDKDGLIVSQKPVPLLGVTELEEVCADFRGEIEQVPPMYSALKKDGVPLYRLARQGLTVEREPRRVTIDKLEVLSFEKDLVEIEVQCSKGTYIRSLVADIGEKLGCGAHLTSLCRTRSGPFVLAECFSLEDLERLEHPAHVMLSLAQGLRDLVRLDLSDDALSALTFGIPPTLDQVTAVSAPQPGALVRMQAAHELVAVARFAPHRHKEKRGDFELLRVFVSR